MSFTPSQRLSLVREIGKRLGPEGYELIDLTLRQFSLPQASEWNGTSEGYVMAMIQDTSDESLTELAQHLGFEVDRTFTSRIDPAFWHKGMFRDWRAIRRRPYRYHRQRAGRAKPSLRRF
jgi:hypothetical protein